VSKYISLELASRQLADRLLDEAEGYSLKKDKAEAGVRKKALSLLRKTGIRYREKTPPTVGANWTGTFAAIGGLEATDVLHELAHYQCSPPKWRRYPEFGLGMGPDVGLDQAMPGGNLRESDYGTDSPTEEEERASLLGIMWERHLGLESWAHTIEYHNWINLIPAWSGGDPVPQFVWLMRTGLLTTEGEPVLALRTKRKAPYREWGNKNETV